MTGPQIIAAAFAFAVGSHLATYLVQNIDVFFRGIITLHMNRRSAASRLAKVTCGQCFAGLDTYYCPRCGWHAPPSEVDTTLERFGKEP